MELINKRSVFVFFVICSLIIISCKEQEVKPSTEVLEVNEFIWKSMNDVYLWNEYLPQNINRTDEFDPEAYFDQLLFKPTDKWSFITDDHEALLKSFKGIEKTFGHEFKLFQMSGTSLIYGIVKYVVPNSPADEAQVKRGDLFYKVNGIQLSTENYYSLLFDRDSYELSFGEFDQNGQLSLLEEKILSAIELTENPIFIKKTLDIEGSKIGYLLYNRFINDFDEELISAFHQFKNENVQDIIVDLRYNPGGTKSAAVLLSSMIAPSVIVENKEVYSKTFWNEDVHQYWIDEEGEESPNLITRFITPEVNLDLDRIYIITTSNSASASELVINCLNPYMEVIIVGSENTRGKYVGSITVHDEAKSHGWALQPIVMKAANSEGVSDYSNGFAPDHVVYDGFNAELGTLAENMLAKSVELITGKVITEPARIAALNIPENSIPISNPMLEKRELLRIELSK